MNTQTNVQIKHYSFEYFFYSLEHRGRDHIQIRQIMIRHYIATDSQHIIPLLLVL